MTVFAQQSFWKVSSWRCLLLSGVSIREFARVFDNSIDTFRKSLSWKVLKAQMEEKLPMLYPHGRHREFFHCFLSKGTHSFLLRLQTANILDLTKEQDIIQKKVVSLSHNLVYFTYYEDETYKHLFHSPNSCGILFYTGSGST